MAISNKVLKILWAQSSGLCAFPGCHQELIAKDSHEILGHVCHIVAQNPTGPRGDPSLPKEQLDGPDNLLLLCPTHHKLVDSEVERFTVEALQRMRAEHLIEIDRRLHTGQDWKINFSQLYYMNLPRLSVLAAYNGMELNYDFMERFSCLHAVGFELGALMRQMKAVVSQLAIQAVELSEDLHLLQPGQTVSFTETFCTKNIPSVEEVCADTYVPESDLSQTPQIDWIKGSQKLIMTLDPRWLATTTSFVDFRRRHVTVAGLAVIKQVSEREVIASPYLLGVPSTPFDALFPEAPPRSITL